MTDDDARASLGALVEALKASIPIQKAIDNNLQTLEKLRAYGYGHAFICQVLNESQNKQITPQMFASMMSRARKKKPQQKRVASATATPVSASTLGVGSKTFERAPKVLHNPTPPPDIFD